MISYRSCRSTSITSRGGLSQRAPAPLLALAGSRTAVTPDAEPAANPEPAEPQASCDYVAVSVLERGASAWSGAFDLSSC